MNTNEFIFRNKAYSCAIYVDKVQEYPCYVFVDLADKDLADEFGHEIAITTDFQIRLPRKDDYPALVALRQAIFDAIQTNREFIDTKNKMQLSHSFFKSGPARINKINFTR